MSDLLQQLSYVKNHEATLVVMQEHQTGIGVFCGDGMVHRCRQSDDLHQGFGVESELAL